MLLFALCQLKAPEIAARGDSREHKLGAEDLGSTRANSFIYVYQRRDIQRAQMSVNKSPRTAS